MTDSSDNSTRRGAAQRAAAELRQRILVGELKPGELLAGERELSEMLGVSRLTLRSAIATLEAEGLVKPVHGSGTRVLDHRETGGVDLLGHLAHLALTGTPIPGGLEVLASLLELRRAVAVEAVGLATERASAAELGAMRAHVAMQRTLLSDPIGFMREDLAFARLIVRATKNLAFELLFNTVVRTVEGNPGVTLAFFANAPATLQVYERLLDRMQSRDAERARQTASRLLHRLDRTTVDAIARFSPLPAPAEKLEAPAPEPTVLTRTTHTRPRSPARNVRARTGRRG
jgi:GntR family transcriptional regulator, transcriptional repressor for pyruvate dehydrogenase complex